MNNETSNMYNNKDDSNKDIKPHHPKEIREVASTLTPQKHADSENTGLLRAVTVYAQCRSSRGGYDLSNQRVKKLILYYK